MKISPEWEERIDALPRGIFFTTFVLAFVTLALFLALLYRQIELTLFALTLMGLAFGLRIWSRFSTRHLTFRLTVDKGKVFPGEEIDLRLIVENNKFLPVLVETRLLLPASLLPEDRELLIRERSGLLWHQKVSFGRVLRPARRGVYQSGAYRLITGDFFGFFPKPLTEERRVDILVFPRLVPVRSFPFPNRIMFGKKAHLSPIQDPIRILGTRDYRSFSPARNIHWKATARHDKLQEKIFEVTEQEKLLIVLEADGFVKHQDETVFEQAIEAIGALSFEMDARHYAMGFMTNCGMHGDGPRMLKPGRNPRHLPRLFEMLARIQFHGTAPMDRLLTESLGLFQGSSCLFFSYDPVQRASPLRRANLPLTNVICRPKALLSAVDKDSAVRTCFLEEIINDA
jgi:uncharacterized protein (DUF58 family)